ncbi:hypothetical protein predicted by Glimmer/Critica [Bdellovibrio bacteriovorus HD100]|uniref:Uncharacterized protein n=1 Tax=Bdellovibrio bacteriovorus (strain ATCC 15356 / DSM 50701 / NCIMB 9529 / HD100) TaxID=264462 RepID=Q6MQV2_BDEBA|nr:hypothetical protein predicted by Glimmer/Critica [Bdellovibrio bacteriovorus HD100]
MEKSFLKQKGPLRDLFILFDGEDEIPEGSSYRSLLQRSRFYDCEE